MKKLEIQLKDNSYTIIIEDGLLSHLCFYLEQVYSNKKIFILTDDIVKNLYLDKVINELKKKYEVDYVVVPNGENSKSIMTYTKVCEEFLNKGIRRNDLLLALGGGVIGDLCGFIAGTIYRGIPYVNVPTTLLSQMDSSIGGKTGIDFADRKNILGVFKQPIMVCIDPKTLDTLNDREMNNGMGELIKHGAIGNRALLMKLKDKPKIDETIIYESLSVKKKVVEKDEFDLKERMTLNFGHTFGHAIELKYGYKHGEAVAIGMLMAVRMGMDLKITDPSCYPELKQILQIYHLPIEEYDYREYLKDTVLDKKNIAGIVHFIFLTHLGECKIYPITESQIKERFYECDN